MSNLKTKLVELATRCEQADGPNYCLEVEICSQAGPAPTAPIPNYSASIDAAMTLVSESVGINIDRYWNRGGARWKCEISTGGVPNNPRQVFDCWDARTAALAVCAAALRARAGQTEEASHGR